MLTLKTYKKLEGLIITTEPMLVVTDIIETLDRYSIWLSNRANIEIERNIHKAGSFVYYKTWYSMGGRDNIEFVTTDMIDTLSKMKAVIKVINDTNSKKC